MDQPSSINSLPQELLEYVFDLHVNFNLRSRYPLLQMCRQWYQTTTSCPNLWRSIALCSSVSLLPPETVLCKNLKSLSTVIKRTGSSSFELYLGDTFAGLEIEDVQRFVDSVDGSWLSRCRSLTVGAQNMQDPLKGLGSLFFSGNLSSLEMFEIRHHGRHFPWKHILHTIMEKINSSSLGLKELRIRVMGLILDAGTGWITRNIYRWPNVLRRINRVLLRDTCEPIPWSSFVNLEHIEVWCDQESHPLIKLDIPPVKYLTIKVTHNPNHLIPQNVWSQLTHLTLKNTIDEFGPFTLDLPSLISLRLIVCGIDLRHIRAPKLEELTWTVDTMDDVGPFYNELEQDAPFTSRVVHIDIQTTEEPFDLFDIFAQNIPLWIKVEELYLKVVGEEQLLETVIFEALSGEYLEQCYPKLHSLTVIYRLPATLEDIGGDDNGQYYQVVAAEHMRALLAGRVKNEVGVPMKRLEVGWYVDWGDDYVESEWRIVKWIDCLPP